MMLQCIGVPLEEIPKFRLIGSKHNMLEHLSGVITENELTGDTFFDAFSGSASVGRYFKTRYRIISNDQLYFSYVLQNGMVVLNELPKFDSTKINGLQNHSEKKIIQILQFLNTLPPVEGFIYKHYTPESLSVDGVERRFFSKSNGGKIDAVRTRLDQWLKEGDIIESEFYYLLTMLLLAVQKVSNISGTYGAFNKSWDPRSYKPLTLKFLPVIPSSFKHIAFNENSIELAKKIEYDIAYLDPPYNARQYISNYHVLETIAKNDNPNISGKTGMRSYSENDKSVFCSKNMAKIGLSKLLNSLKSRSVIMSYSSDGLLSKEEILDEFERSKYRHAELIQVPHRRYKSNSRTSNRKINEYIFIAKLS